MAKVDAPPTVENTEAGTQKGTVSQVNVTLEDLSRFASVVQEGAKSAVDSAAKYFGIPELYSGAEGDNSAATVNGPKQDRPEKDFDPRAGGGCFGDIPPPPGLIKSGAGKDFPALNALRRTDSLDLGKMSFELNKLGPGVEKRASFEDAMKEMAEDFPESFKSSQDLMRAAFRMAQTGDLDVNQVRDLAQRAAREFAQDASGQAAQRMRAISEQLHRDYGISINIGQKGLEIRNDAQGQSASMIVFDQHGNITARTNVAPGGIPRTVSAEEALKNIAATRFRNAFGGQVGEQGHVPQKNMSSPADVTRNTASNYDSSDIAYERALQEALRKGVFEKIGQK